MPTQDSAKKRRSRNGCQECRRSHRRCDEAQPACTGCRIAKKRCSYAQELSWGGRSFAKSRFSQCLTDGGVVQVQAPSHDDPRKGQFVYGLSDSYDHRLPPEQKPLKFIQGISNFPQEESLLRRYTKIPTERSWIPVNPDHLASLPSRHRLLLHHFITAIAKSFSFRHVVKNEFCSMYIPIVLAGSHNSSILAAISSVAAAHRTSMGHNQSQLELAQLRALSLGDLRIQINGKSSLTSNVDHISAATALMLCLCETISGGTEPDSRMLHLQGAAAILRLSIKTSYEQKRFADLATEVMLWRVWKGLELLAFQCGKPSMARANNFLTRRVPQEIDDYIDVFDGFSSRLMRLLNEIEALQANPPCTALRGHTLSNPAHNFHEYPKLHEEIIGNARRMMSTSTYKVHPGVDIVISEIERADLEALNEAYHHVVILQAQTHTIQLPATISHIQQFVAEITKSLSKISLEHRSCPGVAVLHAIFAAGCEASDEGNRESVVTLLKNLESCYGMGNARCARDFLKRLWANRDGRTDGPYLQWDVFLREMGWDLSLY